ncbi:glycosyltransferase family 4 protein [Dyadobacter sp. CY347]|uniref:glycosyltransferase family 4 protein n=1 Tax=Dyadobacter sp. CY347 TaxID=2909336 RepID=UPI001F1FA014|nr:glycosyltransferase family 4 protein [Dyadobacter sp. CY347]MCF2491104.1 glycosyltransferase family 4 protein [Dyadobacter sp. CY347]
MKKKKLIYILHDIKMGGVEVALTSAIPELHAQFELRVMVLGTVDKAMTAHLTPEELACFYTFDYKLFTYPFFIFKLVAFVLRFNPDVMICSLWRASLVGTIVKRIRNKIPFLSCIHSTRFVHVFDKTCTLAALNVADKILADSTASADFIRNTLHPKVPVEIVSFYTHSSPSRRNIAPYHTEDIKFMFLGRLNPVKNMPMAIDLIHDLRALGWPVTLDIYGRDNGVMSSITEHIRNKKLENYIHFKSELNYKEKIEAFGKHNFLLQLSLKEGMAMSVAEAMQNGLVCIVSPVGEIPNYAKDMESAIFVDIWKKEAWAEAITKIERVFKEPELYERLSLNCYENLKNVETYSKSLIRNIERVA